MATIKAEETIPFLDELIKNGGSDVHLVEGKPIMIRRNGELVVSDISPPTREDLQIIIELSGARMTAQNTIDFSRPDHSFFYHDNVFRISFFTAARKESFCAVIRHLPQHKVSLEKLGLPRAFKDKVLRRQNGLVLVVGTTGSGKTTTLAAAIDHINQHVGGVIITLEDPVEIWHQENRCRIVQLQLGDDFDDYATAIKHCMRRDPDVIMIGELRDHESIAAALTAAETGHLVFGTLHTASAKDTITRILDGAPERDRDQQRAMLAKNLLCVVAQKLVPTITGGLIGAFELMLRSEAIGNLIRSNDSQQVHSEINTGASQGMITLDQSLLLLLQRGIISQQVALDFASMPEVMRKKLTKSA